MKTLPAFGRAAALLAILFVPLGSGAQIPVLPTPTAPTPTPSPSPTPSPTPIPFESMASFDFEEGPQGWEYLTPAEGVFEPAIGMYDNGALIIQPVNRPDVTELNHFGIWDSPLIEIQEILTPTPSPTPRDPLPPPLSTKERKQDVPPAIFQAEWDLRAERTREEKQIVRFRAARPDHSEAFVSTITSIGPSELSPGGGVLSQYVQFFSQADGNDEFRFSYDMLAIDISEGLDPIALEKVAMFNRSSTLLLPEGQEVLSLDFTSGTSQGFTPRIAEGIDAPRFQLTDRGLTIGGALQTARQVPVVFGYWGREVPNTFEGGKLYRLSWTVRSTVAEGRELDNPTFRLRMNDGSLQASWYAVTTPIGGDARLPFEGSPETYDTWILAPMAVNGERMVFSFDYLVAPGQFIDSQEEISLSQLEVRSFDLPAR